MQLSWVSVILSSSGKRAWWGGGAQWEGQRWDGGVSSVLGTEGIVSSSVSPASEMMNFTRLSEGYERSLA
jgi:hypothetical protein